jgi:hypothetical protein
VTDKPEQCGAARTTTSDGAGAALCPCGNYAAPHPFPGCPTPGPVRKAKLEGPGADGGQEWTAEQHAGHGSPCETRPDGTCAKPPSCSGEEGFCPRHGFHRHAPAPEPGLREQYAAAIDALRDNGGVYSIDDPERDRLADAVLNVRDAELQQLRAELAQWYAADSADAAAGSYAGRAEAAEQQRDQLRDLLREVLNTFARVTAPPNPNALGYQGASIAPADFERWQAALDQPQEQP